ncbi:DUF374 domain-containing protein [Ponticoccus sp. SC2-23]|uniref:lysophospholipid acyltransferase family protein n=1 Tax=Alexandriicola marinus TaxID=2081710 RepID=UPI000FDB462F|nr:DUF374 domain-containing protein [Alexandriicola marinus]MBM1222007.1 DUF374 domain-containing protein [Ponticoccus sp. SC6-9]MBM1226358.1 DUF374 domain-containing protein [Ponticoccus sp. SC6-15]MBM1230954.1 DUF374 domain-containing protein [Ponticoccus sp. SC6-38]MBM1235205.1 DUF374 domain-containing protein [Ponticoccus sp. SC6-45]MBM1239976.1 DUF374 domain-containing protein [Ponticoccus sp. SC6-49]MBM1244120.1 DUF374 domain-containing protein [Ponticoccus sp. SC2-64]MBM1248729.1 DUF3
MALFNRLRRRLERSDGLAEALGLCLAAWIRLCHRTTRWQAEGLDQLGRDLRDGPVIVILWHESLLMGPALWPADQGPLTGIRDPSPIARVAGAVQRQFGLDAAAMSRRKPNQAAVRQVLLAAQDGTSIAITGDGPDGPRQQLKSAPLDWARAARRPVYVFAWGTRRHIRVRSWDRMILPLPFSTGAYRFDRFSSPLSRRAGTPDQEAARSDLTRALQNANALCAQAVGRT